MDRVIHKVELLSSLPKQTTLLPKDAKILKLGLQCGLPSLWYLKEVGILADEPYEVLAFTTGEPIKAYVIENYQYLDTLLYSDGTFVVHYYINKV